MKKRNPPVTEKKIWKYGADGLYHTEEEKIEIDPRLTPRRELVVIVHEYLHHIFPEWSESKVDKTSRQIGNFLWKQNYRKSKL
jgi:hypothetical protein